MIQDDAKKLLEKIDVSFDTAHREVIFGAIDQFAASGGNKAKLMGAMMKAYLARGWEFNRTPDLATLQKFVGGDFKIKMQSSSSSSEPPEKWYIPPTVPPDKELVEQWWPSLSKDFAAGKLTGAALKDVGAVVD